MQQASHDVVAVGGQNRYRRSLRFREELAGGIPHCTFDARSFCPARAPRPALPVSSAKRSRVLAPVVGEVLAGLERLPPCRGWRGTTRPSRRARLEVLLGPPAERVQLRRVERVAAVVARPVLDVADELVVGAGQLEDAPRDVEVLELVACRRRCRPRPRSPSPQHQLDRGAVVARRGASRASGGRRRRPAAARRRARSSRRAGSSSPGTGSARTCSSRG